MKPTIVLLGALSLALAMSGCAATSNLTKQIAADINITAATLNDPNVQAAAQSLKNLGTVVVCAAADLSAVTNSLAKDVKATATVDGSQTVNVTTANACAILGGVPVVIPLAK